MLEHHDFICSECGNIETIDGQVQIIKEEIIQRFEDMFEFKDNFRTLNNDRCLLLTENDFKDKLNQLRTSCAEKDSSK